MQAALLLQHCMHRERLFKDIAKMVQYFAWQPSVTLSTQGPTITDVKGESKYRWEIQPICSGSGLSTEILFVEEPACVALGRKLNSDSVV